MTEPIDVPQAGSTPDPQDKLDEMLDNLNDKSMQYFQKVRLIRELQQKGTFKLLSKNARNKLVIGMLDDVADLEELTKITFRALKKVKRERVPENIVDGLLGVPEFILNSADKDDFDNQPFGTPIEE